MTKLIQFYRGSNLAFTISTDGSDTQEIWEVKLSPQMMSSETSYFEREPRRFTFMALKDANIEEIFMPAREYLDGVSHFKVKYYVDASLKFVGYIDTANLKHFMPENIVGLLCYDYYNLFGKVRDDVLTQDGKKGLGNLLSEMEEAIEDNFPLYDIEIGDIPTTPTITVTDKKLFNFRRMDRNGAINEEIERIGFFTYDGEIYFGSWRIVDLTMYENNYGVGYVSVVDWGEGYPLSGGALHFSPQNGYYPPGTQAQGFYTTVSQHPLIPDGGILSCTITNGGMGYSEPPTVTPVDPTGEGSGALLRAGLEEYSGIRLYYAINIFRLFPNVQFAEYEDYYADYAVSNDWGTNFVNTFSGEIATTFNGAKAIINMILEKYELTAESVLDSTLSGYTYTDLLPDNCSVYYSGNALSGSVYLGSYYDVWQEIDDEKSDYQVLDFINSLLFYFNFFIYCNNNGQVLIEDKEWSGTGTTVVIDREHIYNRKYRKRLAQDFPYRLLNNISGNTSVLESIIKENRSDLFRGAIGVECNIFGLNTYSLHFGDTVTLPTLKGTGSMVDEDYQIDVIQEIPEENSYYIKAWAV